MTKTGLEVRKLIAKRYALTDDMSDLQNRCCGCSGASKCSDMKSFDDKLDVYLHVSRGFQYKTYVDSNVRLRGTRGSITWRCQATIQNDGQKILVIIAT